MPDVMQSWTRAEATAALGRALRAAQAADGGWPYYAGRASRIEPTAWAMLALAAVPGPADAAVDRGRAFLQQLQQPDGLLLEPGVLVSNYAWNGLALLADISSRAATADANATWRSALTSGVLAVKGIALEQDGSPVRQNNRLQAWSWIDGTFSWIEPTAMCVLALKKARAAGDLARARLAEAEAVIVDRVCEGGGWNYGNAQVLGQDLRPYVPTTAMGVLAMQDRRDHPAIKTSIDWLNANGVHERSAMALSWAAIAERVVGGASDATRQALLHEAPGAHAFGNFHLMAMALYALTLPDHGARAFSFA